MSKYTTEVRFIVEKCAGLDESIGYNSVNEVITKALPLVFNFDFPIFDETYRPILERKILKHYYTREICAETVGLWKHYLDMRLNEIMPFYNKLYESELLAFNPLYDVDLTKDHTGKGTSDTEHERNDNETQAYTRTDNLKSERESERTDDLQSVSQDGGTQGDSGSDVNKNTRWDVYSDTPQGSLQNVANETYLTNARKIIDDGTGSTHSNTTTFGKRVQIDNTGTQGLTESQTNTGTQRNDGNKTLTSEATTGVNTTEEYLEHVKGKTPGASFSKLLKEYRETFLNIDMMIIEDLSDLFFGLW